MLQKPGYERGYVSVVKHIPDMGKALEYIPRITTENKQTKKIQQHQQTNPEYDLQADSMTEICVFYVLRGLIVNCQLDRL